jgi:hypothetical protein
MDWCLDSPTWSYLKYQSHYLTELRALGIALRMKDLGDCQERYWRTMQAVALVSARL